MPKLRLRIPFPEASELQPALSPCRVQADDIGGGESSNGKSQKALLPTRTRTARLAHGGPICSHSTQEFAIRRFSEELRKLPSIQANFESAPGTVYRCGCSHPGPGGRAASVLFPQKTFSPRLAICRIPSTGSWRWCRNRYPQKPLFFANVYASGGGNEVLN